MPKKIISLFSISFITLVSFFWLKNFYTLIKHENIKDMLAYQHSIDKLGNAIFSWDLLSPEVILNRTYNYGEYLASIIFQVTGLLGLSAITLHIITLLLLAVVYIYTQLKYKLKESLYILILVSCPILFSNLLLGNTRQIWGCIIIILFYGNIPLFEFFYKNNRIIFFKLLFRVGIFCGLLVVTHIGSVIIFIVILLIDYWNNRLLNRNSLIDKKVVLDKTSLYIFLALLLILIALSQFDEVQKKIYFYLNESGLDSYPYYIGGFFYLIILPLSLEIWANRNKNSESLRLIWKIIISIIICSIIISTLFSQISHVLDRIITSLVLLFYFKKISTGSLQNELFYSQLRILACLYYLITRS